MERKDTMVPEPAPLNIGLLLALISIGVVCFLSIFFGIGNSGPRKANSAELSSISLYPTVSIDANDDLGLYIRVANIEQREVCNPQHYVSNAKPEHEACLGQLYVLLNEIYMEMPSGEHAGYFFEKVPYEKMVRRYQHHNSTVLGILRGLVASKANYGFQAEYYPKLKELRIDAWDDSMEAAEKLVTLIREQLRKDVPQSNI